MHRFAPASVALEFRQIEGNVYRKGLTDLHRALVAPLVAREAQRILPLGMTMVPVSLSVAELTDEIGLPVLDPVAVTLRLADALATTGYVNSRAAYPAASLS